MYLEYIQCILAAVYDKEKLRKLRKKRNLTQEQLHRLTALEFPPDGVSLVSIQKIELGDRDGRKVMWKIAKTLGVSEESLRLKNGKNGKRKAS